MITSKSIIQNTPSTSGYHIVLRYVFSSGDTKEIKIKGVTQSDAATYLESKSSEVQSSISKTHAKEAFQQGITTAHKEASDTLVKKEYLYRGFWENEPYIAYETMSKVAGDILALGLSVEQMAVAFGESTQSAQDVLDRWNYLDANKDIINQYKAL